MNTIIKTGLGERLMFIYYFCVYIILYYITLCFCVFLIYQKGVHSFTLVPTITETTLGPLLSEAWWLNFSFDSANCFYN